MTSRRAATGIALGESSTGRAVSTMAVDGSGSGGAASAKVETQPIGGVACVGHSGRSSVGGKRGVTR